MDVEINGRKLKAEEILVDGKKFVVREMLANEVDKVITQDDDVVNVRKKQIMIATGLTSEEYEQLTYKERLKILSAFSRLNIEDFQQPVK